MGFCGDDCLRGLDDPVADDLVELVVENSCRCVWVRAKCLLGSMRYWGGLTFHVAALGCGELGDDAFS